MRVVSGEYRSRKLITLTTDETRPTLDKVKAAVFNHLGPLNNKDFLDLFAGSGAIGIEALSRGIKQAVFNDVNPQAVAVIKENLNNLKVSPERYQIMNLDFNRAIRNINKSFDIIYLDPPFNEDLAVKALKMIKKYDLLKDEGEIVIESEKNQDFSDWGYRLIKVSSYGRIKISYLGK